MMTKIDCSDRSTSWADMFSGVGRLLVREWSALGLAVAAWNPTTCIVDRKVADYKGYEKDLEALFGTQTQIHNS